MQSFVTGLGAVKPVQKPVKILTFTSELSLPKEK